jgi:glycerol-3-phosphate dehydrogenase (NAD(P)+)
MALSRHHEVFLWTRNAADCRTLDRQRESRHLPGLRIPEAVRIMADFDTAVRDRDLVLVAVTTAGLRETLTLLSRAGMPRGLAWACKGFERPTGRLPHEVVAEVLPGARRIGALSGPSFAQEVARGQPTAVVFASGDADFAASTAAALNDARLRVYSSTDLIGVEMGGALKNVIAIAAGISDGLGLGRNARAALVTRGLAEIVRLGAAMGGKPQTFMGLAGLGDLVLTCTGDLSRNREVGIRLASGAALESILASLGHVAEGVSSARAAQELARRHQVEMPVADAVCRILFEGMSPAAAVEQLLARDPRAE